MSSQFNKKLDKILEIAERLIKDMDWQMDHGGMDRYTYECYQDGYKEIRGLATYE